MAPYRRSLTPERRCLLGPVVRPRGGCRSGVLKLVEHVRGYWCVRWIALEATPAPVREARWWGLPARACGALVCAYVRAGAVVAVTLEALDARGVRNGDPSARRWVERRVRLVHHVLSIVIGLLPDLLAQCVAEVGFAFFSTSANVSAPSSCASSSTATKPLQQAANHAATPSPWGKGNIKSRHRLVTSNTCQLRTRFNPCRPRSFQRSRSSKIRPSLRARPRRRTGP